MIATDEESLICDLAETYQIYDYKSLPLSKVAIFAVGLRDNSRIKMKMNNMQHSFENILLASCVDRLTQLLWMNSKDGANGLNRPKTIVSQMISESGHHSDMEIFDSPNEFEARRNELLMKGNINGYRIS